MNSGANPFHGARQGIERFGAVVVQALNFVVQVRALLCDPRSHIELRVECRARHPGQLGRCLAALGQRGEKRDVQCVRKPENVRDQAVVIVEAHHNLLSQGRRKQLACGRERLS